MHGRKSVIRISSFSLKVTLWAILDFYSQYATVNELNTGKKNASDTCPSCMEEAKKHVQC